MTAMSQPGAEGVREASRCTRCGTEVEGTRHTRTGYVVGGYVLHTGRTVEATIAGRDDEVIAYRRLVEAFEVVACPACLSDPGVRRLWERFGDEEDSAL